MLLHLFCVAILSVPALSQSFPDPSEKFARSAVLRKDFYRIFWTIANDTITFEIQVKNLGWVGLGFSPNGNMPGSDVVIGWVTGGRLQFADRHAVTNSMPLMDQKQDCQAISGRETGSYTVIKFRRRLKTCDPEDRELTAGTVRLIYAWNPQDPASQENIPYHAERGTISLSLFDNPGDIPNPPDAETWTFKIPNFTAPPLSTTYWSFYYALPKITSPRQIIKMWVDVQPGNEDFLHHFVLSRCDPDVDPAPINGKGHSQLLYGQDPLFKDVYPKCNKMVWAWAMGGQGFSFPNYTGILLDTKDSARAIVFDVHYDTTHANRSRTDGSTMNIMVTRTLRKYNADYIFVDGTPLTLPPKIQDIPIFAPCQLNICPQSRTGVTEVKIMTAFLHSHMTGRRLYLRHFRNGTELPMIFQEPAYDNEFQQTFMLPQGEVTVNLQTDMLVMECHDDTSDRTTTTYEDFSTWGEMCMAFLHYYPAIDFIYCGGTVDQASLLSTVGIQQYQPDGKITKPTNMAGQDWHTVLDTVDWTNQALVTKFKKVQTEKVTTIFCTNHAEFSEMPKTNTHPFNKVFQVYDPSTALRNCTSRPLEPMSAISTTKSPTTTKSPSGYVTRDQVERMFDDLKVWMNQRSCGCANNVNG